MKGCANCWICEGWQEREFIIKPKFSFNPLTMPVKIHLSCDNFEGHLLNFFEDNTEKEVVSVASSAQK